VDRILEAGRNSIRKKTQIKKELMEARCRKQGTKRLPEACIHISRSVRIIKPEVEACKASIF